MTTAEQQVHIIDDDASVRHALSLLFKSVNISATTYASANEFMDNYCSDLSGCLLVDIRMPGMSGIDLQKHLKQIGCHLPLIFITGHGDIPMAVEAMRNGAVDFLQKPFRDQELLDQVNAALKLQEDKQRQQLEQKILCDRVATLTPREQEVMSRIVAGDANKVIAIDLGLSQRTVEIHRARVMEKMQARSLAQLVRMAVNVEAIKNQQ